MSLNEFAQDAFLAGSRIAAPPIALSGSYPAAACFRDLQLTEIPEVMDRKGFNIGAALMRRWFRGSAFLLPDRWKRGYGIRHMDLPGSYIDSSTVSMKWAMQFARTQAVYGDLKSAVLGLSSEKSAKLSWDELYRCLTLDGKIASHETRFGDMASSLALIDSSHMNARPVSSNRWEKLADPLDDLYCALGAFTLHVSGRGRVIPSKRGVKIIHTVCVEELLFYIRDSYDFSGNQPLGYWGMDGVRKLPGRGLSMVENRSFNEWRSRKGLGADFLVFSDVRREKLAVPLQKSFP
ncbi:DUF6402 family protein [Paracidovorax avenae]|uniref:DUF6402 family protein n=1 Tax=Paracidovorax avenae TaxID=80867 RepID=UPI0012603300|nr:DUF6402 family protein [Paracidovorax avenae]